MRSLIFLISSLLFFGTVEARGPQIPEAQEGDLIFVQSPASKLGPFEKAIQETGAATVKWLRENGIDVPEQKEKDTPDHVALVVNHEIKGKCVVEALPQAGVVLTPLDQFWKRESGARVFVGKLDESIEPLSKKANYLACGMIGKPYANLFQEYQNKTAFYCSSLIQFAFRTANGSKPVFIEPDYKMIFKPDNFWINYFEQYCGIVPLDLSGSNPTELLHSPKITYKTYLLPEQKLHLALSLRGTSNQGL